jgi:flagellar basal-body rod modification protein FlgD
MVTSATAAPATSAAVPAAASDAALSQLISNFGSFLSLLTTQLKNQDPTSPLDTNAFTQQLVAMTGVQQQLLTNQLLQQIAGSKDGGVASAVGLIGKSATAASSSATLAGGSANWTYNLANDAAGGTLTISDASGKTVYSAPASALTAGDHSFTWNGKDFSGVQHADGGTYTLSLMAADGSGAPVASTISVSGTVGSVSEANGQTLVKIGATAVPLSSITSVSTQ